MQASPSEVKRALRGADYPASRDELIELAEEHDASEDVLADLQTLGAEEYESTADVLAELGENDDLSDEDDYEDE